MPDPDNSAEWVAWVQEHCRRPTPVLGDRCVPGCAIPEVDLVDGGHLCLVDVGERVPVRHRRSWVRVETGQSHDGATGESERFIFVGVWASARPGESTDGVELLDGVEIAVEDAPALIEALTAGVQLARR